jgi:hypothetical protein
LTDASADRRRRVANKLCNTVVGEAVGSAATAEKAHNYCPYKINSAMLVAQTCVALFFLEIKVAKLQFLTQGNLRGKSSLFYRVLALISDLENFA